MRKTCPCCRQKWPEGKDPAEDWHHILLSMRLGDFLCGLGVDTGAVVGEIYQQAVRDNIAAGFVAERALAIQDAEELLADALDVLALARKRFALTPAVLGLPEYIEKRGEPGDGLSGKHIDVGGVRVSWADGQLRFLDSTERAEEDGRWLSSLL